LLAVAGAYLLLGSYAVAGYLITVLEGKEGRR
jgi:hypothetical protein